MSCGRFILPSPAEKPLALLQKACFVYPQNLLFGAERFHHIIAHDIAKRIRIPPAATKDRLLPPRSRITRRLGAHPARLAPLVAKQPVQDQTRRSSHALLRAQSPNPPLPIPQRCRPTLPRPPDPSTPPPLQTQKA